MDFQDSSEMLYADCNNQISTDAREHFDLTARFGPNIEQVDPSEILTRIEDFALQLLHGISNGYLPDIMLYKIEQKKRQRDDSVDIFNYNNYNNNKTILISSFQEVGLSFFSKGGISACRYTRIIILLAKIHELVRTGRIAPQRDIYYTLKAANLLFSHPRHVAEAVEDIINFLEVPKHCLNICNSGKGLVAGQLEIYRNDDDITHNCSKAVYTIPGDCGLISTFKFYSTSRYVVIVEKDSVFTRLVEDEFAKVTNSVLITGKGMPDMATRAFVGQLLHHLPHLIPVAVVDWNPSGVSILKNYKFGSTNTLQGIEYKVSNLAWLGVHAEHIKGLPENAFHAISASDVNLIKSLCAGPVGSLPLWVRELEIMFDQQVKADIEAAYEHFGFGAFVRNISDALLNGCYF